MALEEGSADGKFDDKLAFQFLTVDNQEGTSSDWKMGLGMENLMQSKD